MLYAAMLLTIGANVIYHLCQKEIPASVHPVVSLMATYATAFIASLCLLPFFPMQTPAMESLKHLNWASFALAGGIIGLELGFLLVYRTGWQLSLAAAISNAAVAALLLPIGLLLYKERVTAPNVMGVALCVVGVWLVNRR